MADYEIFERGSESPIRAHAAPSQARLQDLRAAQRRTGQRHRDAHVLWGQHAENEALMAAWPSLNPQQYFIIVPNMFGNGLSSSPSNTPPPLTAPSFPISPCTTTSYVSIAS